MATAHKAGTSEDISDQLQDMTISSSEVQTTGESVGREIGRGAYGRVFTVKYRGSICAAKEIHSVLVEGARQHQNRVKEGFLRECQHCSVLIHPNIVHFMGIYYPKVDSTIPVMIMELMDESLRGYISGYMDKPPKNAWMKKCSILIDVAEGLNYLHAQKPAVVHRDLSPNNILLKAGNGEIPIVKIGDLGVAKIIKADSRATQSVLTKVPGTADFMPPESFEDEPVYGVPLDVFSYGGIILFVATHQWPTPTAQVKRKPKTDKLVALTEVERRQNYLDKLTGDAEWLKPLVKSCLNNNPSKRPTMSAMSQQIKIKVKSCLNNNPSKHPTMSAVSQQMQVKVGEAQPARPVFMDTAGNTILRHMGHDFKRRTFLHPTYCEHCSDMIWGQGFVCRVCRFTCHEKCMNHLITLCPYLALTKIMKPLGHKWGKAVTTSRRFCNICRRKGDPSTLLSCQVCNYYTHKNCKMFAMVNCKATSLYIDTLQTSSSQHTHHWIEGNLPKGKCEVCMKSISSDQCLHGQKCTWCGIMVHSCCFAKLAKPKECDYRDLACIVLVPEAVEWYGSDLGRVFAVDEVSESFVEELNDDDEDKDSDEKGYHVIVYDDAKACDQPLKRSSTQQLLVTKKMNAKDVLTLALKKFQIPEEGDRFCLIESTDETITKPVDNMDIVFEMIEATNKIPKLVIVPKEQDDGKTRLPIVIYNQLLGSTIPSVKLSVTKSSTVASIIQDALVIFEMEDEDIDNFVLEQVSLYQNAQATSLSPLYNLWDTITFLKSQPIRKSSLTRFYLRKKMISRFTLAVWGIPTDNVQTMKTAQEYIEKLLPRNLLENTKFGPLSPNAKLMFIDCPSLYTASQICNILDQAPEKLQHYILPNIHPNAIKMEMAIRQEPLLVFVNGRSGGNQGLDLLTKFRHYLNPHQVFDLANGGPHIGLHAFRDFSQFKILIGGGDGTFGWVLSVLEEAQDVLQCKEPPCALLPLGTGNDLARVLSWGPGYSGEKVPSILRSVENANLAYLDRWKLTFKPQQVPTVSVLRKNPDLAQAYGFTNITSLDYELPVEKVRTVVMNNYFGIGLDADIALDFHLAREENSEKFNSWFQKKGVYLQKMVTKKVTAELSKHIAIAVDGLPLDLPDLEGIVILNIQSWGAGAEIWGNPSDQSLKCAEFSDGLFEVVGIGGVMHMGQMLGGLRGGTRLAQGSKCTIIIRHAVSVQVDGEPWTQRPCTITLEKCDKQAAMLQKVGKGLSTTRQMSAKNLAELQKRHTEGD